MFGLLLKICNILELTPNYIFETLFDDDNKTNSLSFDNDDVLVQYLKLSTDNKNLVDNIITHIYKLQKKR